MPATPSSFPRTAPPTAHPTPPYTTHPTPQLAKLQEAARKLVPIGFSTARDFLASEAARRLRVTTGCAALDKILGGGVETGSVLELFGEFRTGKTQLVAQLCVASQLDVDSGGAAGRVIVIDTENAFKVERIAEVGGGEWAARGAP